MGRSNVCVFGDYEGLYYVDRDYLDYYIAKEADEYGEYEGKMQYEIDYNEFEDYEYDNFISQINFEEFVQEFVNLMEKKFNSFTSTGDTFGTIMENSLFEIQIEDNEWSYAVELIQKDNDWDDSLRGLQKRHYQNYLNGMKDVLLYMFPEIGCYGGAWTHGVIKRG